MHHFFPAVRRHPAAAALAVEVFFLKIKITGIIQTTGYNASREHIATATQQ